MCNYKDILKDNWDFYKYAIDKYNADNVACAKIEAKTQKELIVKIKNAVRTEYEYICPDDVDIDNDEELEKFLTEIINWEGEGIYDIGGFESGYYSIDRIDTILEANLFNLDLNKLVNPEIIEQEYGGKVYGVYNTKLKFLVIDDLNKEEDCSIDVFAVLEDAGVRLDDYFYRHDLNWIGDIVRIEDADFEIILDYFNAIDNNKLEIVYLSKI